MDLHKIDYIMQYFSQHMTKEEFTAWRHYNSSYIFIENDDKDYVKRRTEMHLQRGWMTEDKEILKLLENGITTFRLNTAQRILSDNELEFNNCPKCKKLTRTPKAKQCRFCLHNWH